MTLRRGWRSVAHKPDVGTRRGLSLVGAPAAFLIAAFLVPLGVIIYFSFRSGSFLGVGATTFTLDAYRRFFAVGAFRDLLLRSTLNAGAVAVTAIVLAFPASYYLAFRARWHPAIQVGLLVVPAMTSYLLRILAIKIILGSIPYLLTPLKWVGLMHGQLPQLLYTREAVFVTLVWVWVPFAALPIYASLTRMNPNLFESSADLGARPWQTLLFITLPQSTAGLAAAFAYVFIPTLGEWVIPSLVGGSNGLLYGNTIEDTVTSAMDYSLAAVMANMVLVLLVFLTAVILAARLLSARRRRWQEVAP
jgi:spermidine/putrescine transport system permease protein